MLHFLKNSGFFCGILICFSSVLSSCDRPYSNNLSGEIPLAGSDDLSTEYQISLYADSINTLLPFCEVKNSMVYTLGDYSFRVSKYLHGGQTVLYIERGDSGEYGSTEKYYYVKDNMPVLLDERSVITNSPKPFYYNQVYFKQGKVFNSKQKSGLNAIEIRDEQFEKTEIDYIDHNLALRTFEDALNQRKEFDLVFEGITACPKAKYIILSRKEVNSYRSAVKVEIEDEFIQELCSNPLRYKGEKLEINWSTNDSNEAVYTNGRIKNRD